MKNDNPETSVEDFDLYRDESFRDSIGTISEEGKRNFIYPKKAKGRYMKWRSAVAYVLLAFLFIAPWLKIKGQPLLMLNVLERRFVIFGNVFWPQDFHLLVVAMITGVVFVILFTVIYGRVFCGWICPQTIFMEHVFRKIEYWIDGDRGQQIKLSRMPWNAPEKLRKRILKLSVFFIISFAIGNTFLMYLIGNEAWLQIVTDDPKDHIAGLAGMIIFTGVFFFVFTWFREQVCIIVCPYGRLQGAMLDKNSVVIAYDYVRGEKRARFKKKENREESGKGACVDCHQCVDVCPTGIDIRNGTQLECINCAACIDACDAIMDKTGQDRGLIRYASESQIREKKPFRFTTRVIAYTSVLVVLLGIMGFLLRSRENIEATILRQPGLLYQPHDNGEISNLYDFKIINKSPEELKVDIRLIEPEGGRLEWVGKPDLQIDVRELAEGKFFIYIPENQLSGSRTELKLGVFVNDELTQTRTSNFNGPRKEDL